MSLATHLTPSPPSRATYREWRPAHLTGQVELFWYYRGPTLSPRKRIFPNGRVELLVNLGEPYRTIQGAGLEFLKAGCFSALQTGPTVVEQPAWQDIVAVRLKPAGARAVLGTPMSEVTGYDFDLRDLFGRAGDELVERCQEAVSVEERFRIVADWVFGRLRRAADADPAIAWCAGQIEHSMGGVPIAALREETGLSKARLASGFRDQVGLSPKVFARIIRFRRVLSLLQKGSEPLADVALAAGYYDQPHMTVEFRELAGITPSQFLAARHPAGDGSTAADL